MSPSLRSACACLCVIALTGCEGTIPSGVADMNANAAVAAPVIANGTYHFTVAPDFNGGIFGIEIDNHVSFTVRQSSDGSVAGRFRYVQSALGEDFIFSGSVTCASVHDTPVLVRHEDIPAMTANRIKWGGVVEESNDPTLPAGVFIWFQGIDNSGVPGSSHPDLSTLSGFGDEAANEAFCASAAVPNSNFGPHVVGSGQIVVH